MSNLQTENMEYVDCLNCGSSKFQTLMETPDHVTQLGAEYRAVRCDDCDLVYTSPRPTTEAIGKYYPAEYQPYQQRDDSNRTKRGMFSAFALEQAVLQKDYGHPKQPGISTSLSFVAKMLFRRNRQRQNWIPFREPGRLLDFGCGAGRFLTYMQDHGWKVEGMDVNPDVASEVENLLEVPVHAGTLPHPDLKPESYDAVSMWNSLEHVHEPRLVVRAAYEALSPGGILIIGLPNIASWGFRCFQGTWHGLDLPRHLVHFSPETLCDLLKREGYEIESVSQVGRSGWIRKSVKLFQRINKKKGWRGLFGFSQMANSTARWSEIKNQADSIRIIAQKPKVTSSASLESSRSEYQPSQLRKAA